MVQTITEAAGAVQDDFGHKFGDMGRLWRTEMHRRLKAVGLSFVQWSALRYLAQDGDAMVQKDLALAVGIEGPTMVGVLDRMVAMGLVERREASHDRRFKTVHLTAKAETLLGRAEAELRVLRQDMLQGIAEADLRTAIRVFDTIAQRADQRAERS